MSQAMRAAAAWTGGILIGVATFAIALVWTDGLFDGRAQSVLGPVLLTALVAALGSAVWSHRMQGRWWPGPLAAAAVWFVWWRFLAWKSLQMH